ncbi:hypothetical protein EOM86_02985, partial [Candidatus Nomurabacteria bacterium]|nr:hypothetical protein [Candidatus Nomurabacteria bacterium]
VRAIRAGEGEIFIAGGVESMSRAPYSLPKAEKGFPNGNLTAWDTSLGWRYPNPLMKERYGTEAMGETAENVADQTGITRAEQDAFALNAHAFANQWSYHAAGWDQTEFLGKAEQIAPMIGNIANINSDTRSWIDAYQGGGVSESALGSIANLTRYGYRYGDYGKWAGDTFVRNLDPEKDKLPLSFMLRELETYFQFSGMDTSRRSEYFGDVAALGQANLDSGFSRSDVGWFAAGKNMFRDVFGEAYATNANMMATTSALANPQDSWRQALNYQIYAKQRAAEGKSVSYVDFMKWQEKPLQNNLIMEQASTLHDWFGSGEIAEIAFKNAFSTKTWEQAGIYSAANPNMMFMDTYDGEFKNLPSASSNASGRQRNQAELTDAFTVSAYEGLKTAFAQIGESIANKIMSSPFPFSADIAATVRMWLTD